MRKTVKKRRMLRIRRKLKKVNTERYRLSVYRSTKNISGQIIDDKKNITLVSASSVEKLKDGKKLKKTEMSTNIAELLAKRALEKKITKVFFDRGKYKYHGRIKTFADVLRKNGLTF